jgi:dynein heavy chain
MPPSMKLNAEYSAPERALKPSRPPAADAFSAIVAAAEMFDSLAESCIGNRNRFLEHARSPTTGSAKKQAPDWLEEMHLSKARELEHVMTTIEQLEAALEDWTPNIAMAIETQMGKQPVGKGPLAEIEFWRARAAAMRET